MDAALGPCLRRLGLPRAGINARTSALDRHPEVQLARLREYASHRGLEAVEYVDHGASGTAPL